LIKIMEIFNLISCLVDHMNYLTKLSHFLHYLKYYINRPIKNYDNGFLIISIDIDVGSQKLGHKNRGKYDQDIHDVYSEEIIGMTEEKIVPLFIDLFNEYEIPVTFAIRGQLCEVDDPIIDLLINSPVEHDIGIHGYYHRDFTNLSMDEANEEMKLISKGINKYGIKPTSFVFPKNKIKYLSLLEKWDYLCFRGFGSLLKDGMYIKKYGKLYDVHPGMYLGECNNTFFLNKFIDLSMKYNAPIHLWFHTWNFGYRLEVVKKRIDNCLRPFLRYAKSKEKKSGFKFETMRSVTDILVNV